MRIGFTLEDGLSSFRCLRSAASNTVSARATHTQPSSLTSYLASRWRQ
jgi:hypothetical protein